MLHTLPLQLIIFSRCIDNITGNRCKNIGYDDDLQLCYNLRLVIYYSVGIYSSKPIHPSMEKRVILINKVQNAKTRNNP